MPSKAISRMTKTEQEMPEEVWKKIAASTPDSALKSYASREAYFFEQYQNYLKNRDKTAPTSPIQTTPVRSAYPPQPMTGGTRMTNTTVGGIQTKRTVAANAGMPPGGNPTKLGRKKKRVRKGEIK